MSNNWNNYIEYLKVWAEQHKAKEYEGMSPDCYDEFLDNEQNEADGWTKIGEISM